MADAPLSFFCLRFVNIQNYIIVVYKEDTTYEKHQRF